MNYIFLSPHFPPHYYLFCAALKRKGAGVLGVGDASYDSLPEEVKASLTEYYKVESMENYEQVLRATGFFIHKYGRIDRVDSLNEHWLETEAQLRTDFNIPGVRVEDLSSIKLKSVMKQRFIEGGVQVAQGVVAADLAAAIEFAKTAGYPLVAKPDKGVGAQDTHKINNREELEALFRESSSRPVPYFLEEFIDGDIYSFDGVTDRKGRAVFYTSHEYNRGVMETVNEDDHLYYYSLREIPEDLVVAGMNTLRAFSIKERFFHIEFFRTKKKGIVSLEINLRPPGGFTTDMFNYACDIDLYQEWANLVMDGTFFSSYERKYHCSFISRKNHKHYVKSHDEIKARWGSHILKDGVMPDIFSRAMGNYYYIVRDEKLEVIREIISFIHDVKSQA